LASYSLELQGVGCKVPVLICVLGLNSAPA
jgi:hypothetical protein